MHGLMGGGWKRGATTVDAKDPGGETLGVSAKTYRRATPPRQSSTLHRSVVSSEVFNGLDNYMWKLTYKWARHSHPNKPRHWVAARYFGQFNKSRQDKWVFGDRVSGAHVVKFAWTKIVRHQMVKGGASPDDPTLASYWAERRRKGTALPIDRTGLRLLQAQQGRCPLCGTLLLHTDHPPQNPHEWELRLAATRRTMLKRHIVLHAAGTPDDSTLRLVHAHCQRRQHAATGTSPALLPTSAPFGLA